MKRPAIIMEDVINIGVKKAGRTKLQLLLLGVLAGVFIALGAYASNMVIHTINNYGLTKLVQGAIFPIGLMLVLIAGAELFTGNSLMVISLFEKKISWKSMMKNWSIIYISNLIGCLLFAWLIYKSGLLNISDGRLGELHVKIAVGKVTLSFTQAIIRGMLANFVVCLAIWMAIGAQNIIGKIFTLWFPIMVFVISGFEHSIANMYYIPIGILAKKDFAGSIAIQNLNWNGFFYNIIPVTIGNIIGGAMLVGGVYWIIFKYQIQDKKNENFYINKSEVEV